MGLLPLRSLGIQCGRLSPMGAPEQLDLLGEQAARDRARQLELAADDLRRRFGHQIVRRGVVLTDALYAQLDPKEEHTIHPVAFLKKG